jgi:hypothetical protein
MYCGNTRGKEKKTWKAMGGEIGWAMRGGGWGWLGNLMAVNVVGSDPHLNCLFSQKSGRPFKNGSCDGAINNRRIELEHESP